MFTWICPQCGREVPPSAAECPTCAERQKQAAQPQQPAAQAPPPLQYTPPTYQPPPLQYTPPAPTPQPQQAYYPPQPPQQQPPPPLPQQQPPAQQSYSYPPPSGQPQYQAPQGQQPAQAVYTIGAENHKKGMPAWLVAILTIAVIGGGLFGVYKLVSSRNGSSTSATAAAPDVLSGTASKSHPYAKYLEVSGIRIIENAAKKPIVRFAVVNHSPAELSGLELRITFRAVNGPADAEPIAVVEAKVGSVPAHGIKDMESPLNTTMKVYELPDWQFMKSNFEITAPN